MSFRVSSCEQSLREHTNELTAQKLMISQLHDEIQKLMEERNVQGQRLDAVFNLVDNRFAESQASLVQTQSAASVKLENLTAMINSVSQGLAQRLEQGGERW